jgi:hypothetical protein
MVLLHLDRMLKSTYAAYYAIREFAQTSCKRTKYLPNKIVRQIDTCPHHLLLFADNEPLFTGFILLTLGDEHTFVSDFGAITNNIYFKL